jgi:hypothetical protein
MIEVVKSKGKARFARTAKDAAPAIDLHRSKWNWGVGRTGETGFAAVKGITIPKPQPLANRVAVATRKSEALKGGSDPQSVVA